METIITLFVITISGFYNFSTLISNAVLMSDSPRQMFNNVILDALASIFVAIVLFLYIPFAWVFIYSMIVKFTLLHFVDWESMITSYNHIKNIMEKNT
jgi:hypothetical protein